MSVWLPTAYEVTATEICRSLSLASLHQSGRYLEGLVVARTETKRQSQRNDNMPLGHLKLRLMSFLL